MAHHASNALAAKARSKFGQRLTQQHYVELLACSSVGEAALYLKNQTPYGPLLSEVRSTDVHRGRLEELLRRKAFEDFSSLCEFEVVGRAFFYRIIVLKGEIQQLLRCVRLLDFGREDEYLFQLPSFFNNHTELDLMGLARCRDFEEIVRRLQGTPFEPLLRPYIPVNGGKPDLTGVELSLTRYFYETVFRFIRENLRGAEQEELLVLYEGEAGLKNILHLMRVKHSFPELSRDELYSMLLPCGRRVSRAQWMRMIDCATPEETLAAFRSTSFGRFARSRSFDGFEQEVDRYMFRQALHAMRFSQNPTAVFYAYTVILEDEMENIVNIIEGIRYGLPRELIRAMLVYEETASPEGPDPAGRRS